MTYRLPGGRVPVAFGEPYVGLTVEVESIGAWPIYQRALSLVAAFFAANEPAAEARALRELYEFVIAEAQPSWDIADHRGPVPATAAGMLRLPLAVTLGLVDLWTSTFAAVEEEPLPSAVDELYPPGPLRDQLNAALARKRAEAA